MSRGFYSRLAVSNMKKNHQVTVPYLLTGVFLVMMLFMIHSLSVNPKLVEVAGDTRIQTIMNFTMGIVGIFSVIMLFYADSFLMKRRKKELGLFNILGMEKKHIGKMLFWESMYAWLFAMIGGIACGALFSRLLLLVVEKLLEITVRLSFYFSVKSALLCAIFFGILYLVSLILHLMQLKINNPVELLRSENVGEREPKTKWLIAFIGIACLAIGYYLSLSIQSPLSALNRFFVAVLFVIAGTYFVFTAGTIALLKILRRNKKFYYKTRNFTAVSGLIYRMKQNAVGLSSICILASLVLVIMSTTVSMYKGIDVGIDAEMMRNSYVEISEKEKGTWNLAAEDVYARAKELGYETANEVEYYELSLAVVETEDGYSVSESDFSFDYSRTAMMYFLSAEDFHKFTGKEVSLEENHVLMYGSQGQIPDSLRLMGQDWTVDGEIDVAGLPYVNDVVNSFLLIVPEEGDLWQLCREANQNTEGEYVNRVEHIMEFDIRGSEKTQSKGVSELNSWLQKKADTLEYAYCTTMSKVEKKEGAVQFYGGFLFIGLFLTVLFMMGTVLIIYYKQLSEGFEDRKRFQIMQSVGMSQSEVKASIHSQVLIVFFLPLVMAAIHVAVAFPMMIKLISCFNMTDTSAFGLCTVITMAVFVAVYAIVYSLTAKVYYRIVTAKQ
ncbi:MAG: ABC transporter permease [Eubacterium sp.]